MKCRYRRYILTSAAGEMVTAATRRGFAKAETSDETADGCNRFREM
jgi:hypothetical protein